ncbi:hypothetical protein [Psychrobacillus sp. FSL K6-1267]|uniref:hypothetical protein n=1 Tax=Psychrobacillus sp. FSL K6-1267 TaxID=2921543 RepID=UPI0030F9931F
MRTMQSELIEKGLAIKSNIPSSIPKKKVKEKLSERDLQELMGSNRVTYVRGKGGAYKQR